MEEVSFSCGLHFISQPALSFHRHVGQVEMQESSL